MGRDWKGYAVKSAMYTLRIAGVCVGVGFGGVVGHWCVSAPPAEKTCAITAADGGKFNLLAKDWLEVYKIATDMPLDEALNIADRLGCKVKP